MSGKLRPEMAGRCERERQLAVWYWRVGAFLPLICGLCPATSIAAQTMSDVQGGGSAASPSEVEVPGSPGAAISGPMGPTAVNHDTAAELKRRGVLVFTRGNALCRVDLGSGVATPIRSVASNLIGWPVWTISPNGHSVVITLLDSGGMPTTPLSDLYMMDLRNSRRWSLTDRIGRSNEGGLRQDVTYSPNGRMIAFSWGSYFMEFVDEFQLWLMSADGRYAHSITSGKNDNSPSFSPDGRRIVFASAPQGRMPDAAYVAHEEIEIINVRRLSRRRLTGFPYSGFAPSWSPRGNSILFQSTRNGQPQLFRMKPDGSHQVALTGAFKEIRSTAWSLDGRVIAFKGAMEGKPGGIYVMNADGSGLRQITTNPDDYNPLWIRPTALIMHPTVPYRAAEDPTRSPRRAR